MKHFINHKDSEKWTKYVMMEVWGLREQSEVENTIERYLFCDYEECLQAIKQQLERQRDIYIMKLIPAQLAYKLPNYVIEKEQDIVNCRETLTTLGGKFYDEIWYCRAKKNDMFYGRMRLEPDTVEAHYKRQNIEIIRGVSARLLEQFPNVEGEYVSLERVGWAREYQIRNMLCEERKKELFLRYIEEILRKLNVYRRNVDEFQNYIQGCGCKCLSIEFSYRNGKLLLLDWDSDNDRKAIKCYVKG